MSEFKFENREYQAEAVAEAIEAFQNGRTSVLIESPVGSGKTIMGLLVIQEMQQKAKGTLRVNWVASRRHILEQTQKINDEYFHCKLNLVSVFNSNPPKADMIILDEAHHEATQSCLDMYENTGNSLTLGLSATPLRTDKMRLSFQKTVKCCEIARLIKMGVLSPFHSYKIPNWNPECVGKIYVQHPERWGKTIAFFQTLQECRTFLNVLSEAGINTELVTATSNRESQIDAFSTGEVSVIANVSVLSEGFDLPDLQSVFIRDASRLPTIQMAGRGLRKSPEKKHCNLLQSDKTKYPVEKIAEPEESFVYRKNTWLSCSGNTKVISDAVIESLALRESREPVKLPYYFSTGRHVREVNLKGIPKPLRGKNMNIFDVVNNLCKGEQQNER